MKHTTPLVRACIAQVQCVISRKVVGELFQLVGVLETKQKQSAADLSRG